MSVINKANSNNQSPNQLNVEQLFKLLQQHLNLWAKPDGLGKIYPQAATLANHLVQAFQHKPNKWIAQLHQHKPHYDYTTNLSAKAAIFACICGDQLNYTIDNQTSIVAATLTANVAALNALTRQANGHPLTDKHKAIIAKSLILSYKLLIKHQVLDSLWLQTLAGSIPQKLSKRYNLGYEGTIVALAIHFGKMLSNPKTINQISVTQVMRQLYLETRLPFAPEVCQLALKVMHRYGDGVIVKLQNDQLGFLIQHAPDAIVKEVQTTDEQQPEQDFIREDGFVTFVFSDYPKSYQGRFLLIGKQHLKSFEPCLNCDNAKIYAQIWEAPLDRFLSEKGIVTCQPPPPDDIFTPPKALVELVSLLFEQVDLNKLAFQVKASPELNKVVIDTAILAAKAAVKIKDAKHALALLGLNRIGPILYRGAVADRLAPIQFAGRQLVDNRTQCLFHSIELFNHHFNDLVQTESLLMYVQFYLAPWYLNTQLQRSALKLYYRKDLDAKQIFELAELYNLHYNDQEQLDQHKSHCQELLKHWQLPNRNENKFIQELFRQLHKSDNNIKAAKPIAYAIAVIKLATFNCQCLFNQVKVDDPLVKKHLQQYLDILTLKPTQFYAAQQQLLEQHRVYTPLI